jgi:hypothetical protein
MSRCRICNDATNEPGENGCCPFHAGLVALIRRNLEAAAKSKRKPPKKRPLCETSGVPMEPVLWRPDAKWDFWLPLG